MRVFVVFVENWGKLNEEVLKKMPLLAGNSDRKGMMYIGFAQPSSPFPGPTSVIPISPISPHFSWLPIFPGTIAVNMCHPGQDILVSAARQPMHV